MITSAWSWELKELYWDIRDESATRQIILILRICSAPSTKELLRGPAQAAPPLSSTQLSRAASSGQIHASPQDIAAALSSTLHLASSTEKRIPGSL